MLCIDDMVKTGTLFTLVHTQQQIKKKKFTCSWSYHSKIVITLYFQFDRAREQNESFFSNFNFFKYVFKNSWWSQLPSWTSEMAAERPSHTAGLVTHTMMSEMVAEGPSPAGLATEGWYVLQMAVANVSHFIWTYNYYSITWSL